MIKNKKIFFLGIMLVMSYGYFNYFMGRGFGETSVIVSLLKLGGIILILCSCKYQKIKVNGASFHSLLFYILALFSYLIAVLFNGSFDNVGDLLFFNTIVFLPFLFLKVDKQGLNYLFKTITIICGFQILIDIYIFINSLSLEASGAFLGGFGNASTNGVFLILGMVYLMTQLKYSWLKIIVVLCYYVSTLFTFSLFAAVVSTAIIIFFFLKSLKKKKYIARTMIPFSIALITYFYFSVEINEYISTSYDFVLTKLNSLFFALGFVDQVDYLSKSVWYRTEIVYMTIDGILNSPWALLFGHINDKVYWFVDSQYLTYLGSFGFPMFIYFLLLNLALLINTFSNRFKNDLGKKIILYMLLLMFFTNRILDYFPVAMIFLILIKYFDHLPKMENVKLAR